MSEQKLELKESLELVAALQLLGVQGVKIAKGGIGPDDLAHALELAKNSGDIVAGFKGLDQVDDELKDLDDQELVQLGLASWNAYKAVRAAAKA